MELIFLTFGILALFVLSKFMGKILLKSISLTPPISLQLLLGLIVVVSLFATFFTFGKTILLPVSILFIVQLVRGLRGATFSVRWSELKELKWFFGVVVLLSIILGALALNPLKDQYLLSGDYLFYGKLSQYMVETGFETKNLNYFITASNYTEVYHYFDLWLYGLLQKGFGLSSNQSVFAGIFLVFVPLLFQSLADLLTLFKSSRFVLLIAFVGTGVVLMLSGATYFFNFIFPDNEYGEFCGLFSPKLILLYVFFSVFVYQVLTCETKLVILLVSVYSLCFTTILPVYIGVVGIYLFLEYRKNGFQSSYIPQVLLSAAILLYFVVFYWLFSNHKQHEYIFPQSVPLDSLSFKTRINIVGKTSIYMFLGLIPVIVMFLLHRKNELILAKRLFFWMGIGSVIGLISWSLIFHKVDSVQLWSNFYYSSIGIVYGIFCFNLFIEKKYISGILLLLCISVDSITRIANQPFVYQSKGNPTQLHVLNDARVAFFNFYNEKSTVFEINDPVRFGELSELMSFTNCKLISFSSVELQPRNEMLELIIRDAHLYQIKPFLIGKSEEYYVPLQDSLLKKMQISHVAIHKKRSFPVVLNNWELRKLNLVDPKYSFYKLVKRK